MSIEFLLREEITNELNDLKKIALGTEDYKATVDGIVKLMDRAIEIEKSDRDYEELIENRKLEYDLKIKQMKSDRIDRYINHGITILGIGVPACLTIWGTLKSLKFEETGSVTTIMGRGFIQRMLPKK